MLKVIGFNGSPRKGWNTDLMVKSALEGAKAAGAETKLIQINSLKFKPCQSCLVCKKGPQYEGKCTLNDDASKLLEELKTAHAIIFGSPVYFGLPSAVAHSLLERLWFGYYTYRGVSSYPKKTKTGMIFTMNVEKEMSKMMKYEQMYNRIKMTNEAVFNDNCEVLCAYNTQQVKDYSKYRLDIFDAEKKYKSRKEVFPEDLKKAYEMGFRLGSK